MEVLEQRVLREVGRRDARGLQGPARGLPQHAGGGRAVQRGSRSSASSTCRSTRCRTASRSTRTSRSAPSRGSSGATARSPADAVVDRLRYELGVVSKMGFSGYFLVVWDFISYARRQGIAVGPGRGSSAGSLVAYCLGITNVDPIRYGLIFERFLNPERISMPDMDIDFADDRRDEVIRYVVDRYGARPGRPHHHVRDHGGQGGHPRRGPRARLLLRRGGPHRQAGARLPAQHLARRGAREGAAARRAGQARPAGGGDVGGGPRARGLHPPRLGARLRGGHLGRAPDGAGAALQGPQAARAHHRLRDGADREARPAQDGLPRAQDPHRDLGRPAPAQGVARDRARRRRPAARRRADLPAPHRGPHLRRVPAGVRGHAGRAQAPQAPAHRGHHRDGGPVPAGPDGPDRGLRQPQARARRRSPTSTR